MRTKMQLALVLTLFIDHVRAQGPEIVFAQTPIDLFCSDDPIRSIAFRESGAGSTPDLIICAGTDTGTVTVLRSFQSDSYGQMQQYMAGPYGPNEEVYGNEVHIVTGDLESDGDIDVLVYWNRYNLTIPEQLMTLSDIDGQLQFSIIEANLNLGGGFDQYRAKPFLFDVNDDDLQEVMFDGRLEYLFNPISSYSADRCLWVDDGGTYTHITPPQPVSAYQRNIDLDADGRVEIFRSLWSGGTQILSRDPNETFIPIDTIESALESPLPCVDVSGDGTKDILLGRWSNAGYPLTLRSILLDEGWVSEPTLVYERPSGNEMRAHVEDFNIDGLPDILLWSGTSQPNDQRYAIVTGNGPLPLSQEPQPILQCDQRWQLIVDVDADGAPDLVVYDRSCVKWLRNLALSTGIAEQSRTTFRVRPNPTQDFAHLNTSTINAKGAFVRIINSLGQELMTASILGPETQLDLRGIHDGSYFIQVIDQQGLMKGNDHLVIHR